MTAQNQSCTMAPRAAGLVKTLDDATANMLNERHQMETPAKGGRAELLDPITGQPRPWGPHCSQYFRAVMRQLKSIGTKVDQAWTNEFANADALAAQIKSNADDWTAVDGQVVQDLANGGVVVVGIVPGHLGFAFPIPPKLDVGYFEGNGPFVRDGNEHPVDPNAIGRLFPSTWGAVKTSKAFGDPHKVRWFRFNPSVPSTWENVRDWFASWRSSQMAGCIPINPPESAELTESGCALRAVYACQDQCDAKWSGVNSIRGLHCDSACKVANNCCISKPVNGECF